MKWNIYTLGDLDVFESVLNAVAMMFFGGGPNTIFQGTGLFGFGGAITTGLLIALIFTLGSMMMAQAKGSGSYNLAGLLVTVIVLYSFMIKSTVQLEDVYSGRVKVIDNVPIGVAVPASLISTLTRNVSKQFETAFSTTSGNYITMGVQGFVNPVQLLASLRSAVFIADEKFTLSYLTAYRDCGIWKVKASELKDSADPFQYVLDTFGDGLTMYYSAGYPNGSPASCAQAKALLETAFAATYDNGSSTGGAARNAAKGSVTMPNTALTGSSTGRAATIDDLTMALALIKAPSNPGGSAGTNALSSGFGKSLYASPLVAVGSKCGTAGIDINDYQRCTNLMIRDATRQWSVKEAGEASVFTKMVIPSMNMLMAMFFAFAPMVVLVVAVTGQAGISSLAKYFMFGVWTQSWLPMASVINYLIQISVSNDINAIIAGTGNAVTLANVPGIYDALDRKLSVAFSMLSSVPVISFAVLSGSYMGMSKMADRMTGGGQGKLMDSTIPERASAKIAPHFTKSSDYQETLGNGITKNGITEASLGMAMGGTSSLVNGIASQRQSQVSLAKQVGHDDAITVGRAIGSVNSSALTKNIEQSMGGEAASMFTATKQLGHSLGLSDTDSAKFSAAVLTSWNARAAVDGKKSNGATNTMGSVTREDIAAGLAVVSTVAGVASLSGVLAPVATPVAAVTGVGAMALGGSPGAVSPGNSKTSNSKGRTVASATNVAAGLGAGASTEARTTAAGEVVNSLVEGFNKVLGTSAGTSDTFKTGWRQAMSRTIGTTNTDGKTTSWQSADKESFNKNTQFLQSLAEKSEQSTGISEAMTVGMNMTPSQVASGLASQGRLNEPVDAVTKMGPDSAVYQDYKHLMAMNDKSGNVQGIYAAPAMATLALANAAVRDESARLAFAQTIASANGTRVSGYATPTAPTGSSASITQIEEALTAQDNTGLNTSSSVQRQTSGEPGVAANSPTANGQNANPVRGPQGGTAIDRGAAAGAEAKIGAHNAGATLADGSPQKNVSIDPSAGNKAVKMVDGAPSTHAETALLAAQSASGAVKAAMDKLK